MTRVVVVGAGIAGLTAAHDLAREPGLDLLVLEAAPRIGGKLLTAEVGGVEVDVGAEAMLARRPEGVALAGELGLPVVHPATTSSRLWLGGELRPLPRSVLGVPIDLEQLAASGVLTPPGLERVRAEPSLPPTELEGDVSVAELVGSRLGDEVVDRLVEPLLGGVYAGHARALSARATVPQVVSMLDRGSLIEAAAALPQTDTPVFAGIDGGIGQLPLALAEGLTVRTGATVREIRRVTSTGSTGEAGFELVVGSAAEPELVTADRVVLALPAAPAARLLRDLAPTAAAELAAIEYASMAIVTLAFPAELSVLAALGQRREGHSTSATSGFLVPPIEGRTIKASTFSFAKWDWVRAAGAHRDGSLAVLRTSLGRHREEAVLQATDEELVAASLADLRDATGLAATPVATHVQRWGGGLPQYAVGHLDRVDRIRTAVADVPGLAVCGAAYDGVGIPAVIASAHRAAAEIGQAE